MKCSRCPFHLLCHMGRLGAEAVEDGQSQGRGDVSLCPTCGRLVYSPAGKRDMNIYTFFCEQRPLSRDMIQQWLALRRQATRDTDAVVNALRASRISEGDAIRELKRQQGMSHIVSAFMTHDPGPGVWASRARIAEGEGRHLRVAECLNCCDKLNMLSGLGARWVDLDEMERVKDEGKRSVFGLRGRDEGRERDDK